MLGAMIGDGSTAEVYDLARDHEGLPRPARSGRIVILIDGFASVMPSEEVTMLRKVAVMAALLLLMSASGCAVKRPGRAWTPPSAAASPASFRPVAGVCHLDIVLTWDPGTYEKTPCDHSHKTEAFSIGTAPDAPRPPVKRSARARSAYHTCATRARVFLGGPHRAATLSIAVVFPTIRAWQQGARWFECELLEYEIDGWSWREAAGSLAGTLRDPSSPVALRCFTAKTSAEDHPTHVLPSSYGEKHQAEFAGLWTAPATSHAPARDTVSDGCRRVVAAYAGVPATDEDRFSWIWYSPPDDDWDNGERTVQCLLWLNDRSVTRSLKGAGRSALPVRHR
jgi:hypothetical protein